jgi:hypothetical protein
VILAAIPQTQVEATWPIVQKWVQEATERSNGRYDEPSIIIGLMEGRYQLWTVWDEDRKKVKAVVVTQLLVYPTDLKAVDIIVVTGKYREDWKHLIKDLEAYAQDEGCELVQAFARPGWQKELADYKMSHVLLEKRL